MQFVEAPVDLCGLDEREPVGVRGSLVQGKTRPQPGPSLGVLEGLLVQLHLLKKDQESQRARGLERKGLRGQERADLDDQWILKHEDVTPPGGAWANVKLPLWRELFTTILFSSRVFECLISMGVYKKNLLDSYNDNAL